MIYELNLEEASHFQSLICMLRWIVELGRIVIYLESSTMGPCAALPRKCHLENVHHIFDYFKKFRNAELVFEPSSPEIGMNDSERQDWITSEFGHLLEEDLKPERPSNMHAPRRIGFKVSVKVVAEHTEDIVNRKIRTGFVVCLNSSPIC